MIHARGAAIALAASLLVTNGQAIAAQSLASASGASFSVAAPTESDYDAGVSASSGSYAVTTTCTGTGGAGCRLFLQYGTNSQGQQVDMQYAVVSLSSVDCAGAVASPSTWITVQPASVVLSTAKSKSCVATFRFRVSPISYSLFQSPGPPGGNYRQRLNFVFTRP
jgi:hypothetical protein